MSLIIQIMFSFHQAEFGIAAGDFKTFLFIHYYE